MKDPAPFLRGQVYLADLNSGTGEPKFWLIVSNNHRNRVLESVLAVRITSTEKYQNLPTVVAIPAGEEFTGYVRCDSLTEMWNDEPQRQIGVLGPRTMALVNEGLKAALAIT